MFGPKLRRADQPLWLRTALGLFEFAASLKLAVILISACALALGWATFVESAYGTPAVQFGMYGTWWFAALNLLLAINIFAAAAIRYPWKRHQTGFVITHIGLLTLLFGCLMSRRSGIDAQMLLYEGEVGHTAYEHRNHFQLSIAPKHSGESPKRIDIPFASGTFNWSDYATRLSTPPEVSLALDEEASWWHRSMQQINRTFGPPIVRAFYKINGALFSLADRDRGVVYDRDGVQVEVLDYYADSIEVDAPLVKLRITTPNPPGAKSEPGEAEKWMPVELDVGNQPLLKNKYGIGRRERIGGGSLVFMLTGDSGEIDAFLHSAPEGGLGEKGQVVLHVGGETIRVNVDDKLNKERFPLGKTGLEAQIAEYMPAARLQKDATTGMYGWIADDRSEVPQNPAVLVRVYRGEKNVGELTLFADSPEFTQQDYDNHVFGSYWFDHGEKSSVELLQGAGGARIDIVQAPFVDGEKPKLYYRYWNRRELVKAAELPTDGTPVDAFKMKIAELKLAVDEVVPSAKPERKILPVAFEATKQGKQPAAKLRVTVDGTPSEFWLAAILPMPEELPPLPSQQRKVEGDKREVTITLPPDEIDVGFRVRLQDFERKLDPGTSQPSHYSSVVDFLEPTRDKELQKEVLITMNAPVDFSDPISGRSYRLFQESFYGPIRPGGANAQSPDQARQDAAAYERHFAVTGLDEGYMSTLTVNADPGRAVKYTGCLLIIAGIVTMFYMRAYFFKRTAAPATSVKKNPRRDRQPVPV